MFNIKIGILCMLLCEKVYAVTIVPPAKEITLKSNDFDLKFIPQNEKDCVIEDAEFWKNKGLKQLHKTVQFAKKAKDNTFQRKAKNIIIFVGDGMSLTTITAGRIYKGQKLHHNNGEEEKLSFDEFPYTGLAKTYAVDKQITDSAASATAIFTGVKTHYNAIGVDSTRSKTNATKGRLTSIMDWAQEEGKRTGIVTTTRITHSTPASTYAHIYHRGWECDSMVPPESVGIHTDIATQLVQNAPGNKFNVIMGGGLSPMGATNSGKQKIDIFGIPDIECPRNDKRNLINEWLNLGTDPKKRVFVKTRDEMLNLETDKINNVLGVFSNNHLMYSIAREEGEPSLKEMTETAIKVLDRGEDSSGFVLMVEGGRIDHAHHQNLARAAMQEVLEFDMAIQAALDLTDPNETLIIVAADHSHSVTLNGYPKRGNDILGFANKDTDPIVYETISYANGPGYYDHLANNTQSSTVWRPLEEFTPEERMSPAYTHMAGFPLLFTTHSGEDAIVFANGPGSSLIRSVFEQNYLAYVMSYAGCMGPAKNFDETCKLSKNSATSQGFSLVVVLSFTISLFIGVL